MIFRIAILASACASLAPAEVRFAVEQIGTQRADWNKPAWDFKTIHRPSQSAVSRGARITIVGKAAPSCLTPGALANGVMPQQTRLRRDFFTFTNGTDGGLIVMDLGKVTPVSEINSYSAHGPVGGTTWAEEFDGVRGPQNYVLFGSAAARPDPARLDGAEWTKIAEVDTRPKQAGARWGGRWGVNIREDSGALLGKFRWLVRQVRPTLDPPPAGHLPRRGTSNPEWSNAWFAELDVHTPETVAKAGDWKGPDCLRFLTLYSNTYGTCVPPWMPRWYCVNYPFISASLAPTGDWLYPFWPAILVTPDNSGPPKTDQIKTVFDDAAKNLPNVKVRRGTLDDFLDAIFKVNPQIQVVKGEMPDSWSHGLMCDPGEVKLSREVHPQHAAAEALHTQLNLWGAAQQPVARQVTLAYQKILLYGEHTWGVAVSVNQYQTAIIGEWKS
ncbi:MAG: hypothetical protein J0M04_25485 [Verrucomicrobia bacterium]|nr:hypothetical protein [Verrucomicrobiota bacterium]